MVNCLGRSAAEIYTRALQGDQTGFSHRSDLIPGRTVLVGAVPQAPEKIGPCSETSPSGELLLQAYRQIEAQVRACIERFGPARVGIVIGSSTAGIAVGEEAMKGHLAHGSFPPEYRYEQQEPAALSELLARYSGVRGPSYTVSTACSSSAKVFASARNLLALDLCDAVVTGGADALCRLTLNGFSALELVSDKVCDPMSKSRSGITIGEGATLFLITAEEGGVQLLGVGEASDAHHMSAPDPEGRGAELAMRRALGDAGLTDTDIAYINLHGTGTLQNDIMESSAVRRVFPPSTPCSSTKPLVGHTLGAAGAMEVGFCWLMLNHANGKIDLLPHCGSREPDPELAPLHLAARAESIPRADRTAVMSNSFAFGGSNCCVIIGITKEGL